MVLLREIDINFFSDPRICFWLIMDALYFSQSPNATHSVLERGLRQGLFV